MFRFYADPALTTPLSTLSLTTLIGSGDSEPVSAVVYFGKPGGGRYIDPESGEHITVSVADTSPAAGLPAASVKLSLSEAGLASATGGAALELGEYLESGVGNAVAIWVAVDAGAVPSGAYTDLSLVTSVVIETEG